MGKLYAEICMISARGLQRSSSFLKPQWFAVGWVDPNNKYCTKVDSSGSQVPTWKTKFSVPIDDRSSNSQGLSLTIEVYRREPIFLREKLQGTAVIPLKEFLIKFLNAREASSAEFEENGSFQLRKKTAGKSLGFIDVSIRISEKMDDFTSYPGIDEKLKYTDHREGITLAIEDGPMLAFPTQTQQPSPSQYGPYNHNYYPHNPPIHANQLNSSSADAGYQYQRHHTPPPPPPPSNAGFLPTLFPSTGSAPQTYINLPPSSHAGPGHSRGSAPAPGFGMGLGAGALAAGAVIFGDDFMSSSNFTSGLESGSLTMTTDPPF